MILWFGLKSIFGPPVMAGRVLWIKACPSVCPFFCPSFFPAVFLELAHYFFLKLFMVLGAHMEMCVTEPVFFWKNPLPPKMTENGQKWPKIVFFLLFRNIYSLVLSGNVVEWNYLWLFSILRKPHMWEKSGSQVIAKNVLGQSDFSIF